MPADNVELVRRAYAAYTNGDLAVLLAMVDPDLEWTYLNPADADPVPQVCHGRDGFETALVRQQKQGLRSQVHDISGAGDKVLVVLNTPGVDAFREYKADDNSFFVVTMADGQIVALRAFRDRDEAVAFASGTI